MIDCPPPQYIKKLNVCDVIQRFSRLVQHQLEICKPFWEKVTEFIENQSFIQLSKPDFTGIRYKNVQFLEFKNYLCIV